MPKRKYIPQPELKMTDQQLLMQRQIILELINKDRFQFVKTYTNTDEKLFIEIKDILSKASKQDQIFIKNYFILPAALKADYEINKSALAKNPYIYLLMNHDKPEYAVFFAEILVATDGNFYKYLPLHLVEQNRQVALNAAISAPFIFKDLPTKYKINNNFIAAALKGNSLVYCHLSDSQKANRDYIASSLQNASYDDISMIYNAAPNIFQSLKKSDLQKFLKLAPSIYEFLPLKTRSNQQIAVNVVQRDFNQIKYVPKKLHLTLEIMDAFFSKNNLTFDDIQGLVFQFKMLTKSSLTVSDLMDKIIQVFPRHKMKHLASIFGDEHISMLNSRNMKILLFKDPKAFKNLRYLTTSWNTFGDVIEYAIKLDYRNFQYINKWGNARENLIDYMYEDFFKLAVNSYHSNKIKGVHPYHYAPKSFSLMQLRKIVTHKIDGKVVPDYENILKYGSNKIRTLKTVYVNALNSSPKHALFYPLTKASKKNIFKDLNLEARKALFEPWIKKKGIKDVLEIACLKKEILEPLTTNDTIRKD